MQFRFPISPNFSITGQPISRLISGDLPADYHDRIELLDAVLEKFEGVHRAHEEARSIALMSQTGGPGFALYLRNFEVEEFRYSDDPTERMYDSRSAALKAMLRERAERTGSALLSLRGGNDRLDELLRSPGPVFTGQSENWRALVSELIEAAKAIVIVSSAVSPGLLEELHLIDALGKKGRTIVFVTGGKTLAGVLNDEVDPEAFARLKASFQQFTQLYEAPNLKGRQPGTTQNDATFRDSPGAARLDELLADSYAGTSRLDAVRAAPFRILSPSELEGPDYEAAREYKEKALGLLREGFRSLNLHAPLANSVLGNQPDSDHLALRMAHQAFGISAAIEDYVAMIESLVGISEIYTYLLANPVAGNAHVDYAFRLLEIRNLEGVRTQDLPDSQPNLYDYVREEIGNVYYALARMRRAQGEFDNARTAFEASIAVRESLSSLSARKGVAATLHSFAGFLHANSSDADAKAAIDRAISMKEAIYGSGPSEELSASLHNLGSILMKLGDMESANIAISRSLEMKKLVFGTTHHVRVAETALLAARLLIQMGGQDEAVPILRFAQSVFRDLAPERAELAQLDAFLANLN